MSSIIKVQNIQYTDGDAALTIADGGGVTAASTLTSTGDITASNGLYVTGDLPSLTVDKGGIDRSGNTTRIISGRSGGNYADFSINIAGTGNAVNRQVYVDYQGNMTLDNGNLTIGTAGKGIDFSATSDGSSASFSELFDDYEEGVFGTSISCGTSGTVTLNGSYNNMRYTKVGRLVTINADLRISSTSNPQGGLHIAIPFATQNTGHSSSATVVGTCITHSITKQSDQVGRFVVVTGSNLSYIMLQYETTASRFQPQAQNMGLGANDEIVFTMTYTAA